MYQLSVTLDVEFKFDIITLFLKTVWPFINLASSMLQKFRHWGYMETNFFNEFYCHIQKEQEILQITSFFFIGIEQISW